MKILELARQAGLVATTPNGFDRTALTKAEVRFAELLIQGCISQVAMLSVANFENDDIAWTVDTAVKQIKGYYEI